MTVSQNGWKAYADTKTFTRETAAGFAFWAANADVAFVFARLINAFNDTVEKVAGPVLDDWSYANRLVRGSTSVVSNHGSATAIDLNALKHVRGKQGTFSQSQVKAIRVILKDLPVIRWGGDYTTTVDEMHFEINVSAAKLKVFVEDLKEREEMKPADFDKIREIIRAEIVDVLTNEKLVSNLPSTDTTPRPNMSTARADALADQKLDLILKAVSAK